jgi:hypothetical protein
VEKLKLKEMKYIRPNLKVLNSNLSSLCEIGSSANAAPNSNCITGNSVELAEVPCFNGFGASSNTASTWCSIGVSAEREPSAGWACGSGYSALGGSCSGPGAMANTSDSCVAGGTAGVCAAGTSADDDQPPL